MRYKKLAGTENDKLDATQSAYAEWTDHFKTVNFWHLTPKNSIRIYWVGQKIIAVFIN